MFSLVLFFALGFILLTIGGWICAKEKEDFGVSPWPLFYLAGLFILTTATFKVGPDRLNKGLPLGEFINTKLTQVVMVSKENSVAVFCERETQNLPALPCYRVSIESFVNQHGLQPVSVEQLPAPGSVLAIEAITLSGERKILVR